MIFREKVLTQLKTFAVSWAYMKPDSEQIEFFLGQGYSVLEMEESSSKPGYSIFEIRIR